MIISLNEEKNPISFHDKHPREPRNRGNISQHNKGNIQQAQSEHPAEQKKKQAFPLKSRMRQGFLLHHPFSILLNTELTVR